MNEAVDPCTVARRRGRETRALWVNKSMALHAVLQHFMNKIKKKKMKKEEIYIYIKTRCTVQMYCVGVREKGNRRRRRARAVVVDLARG